MRSYREATIDMINAYLDGKLTAQEVSDWALDIIVNKNLDSFAPEVVNAITALSDLHDIELKNASWVPRSEELEKIKAALKEGRIG